MQTPALDASAALGVGALFGSYQPFPMAAVCQPYPTSLPPLIEDLRQALTRPPFPASQSRSGHAVMQQGPGAWQGLPAMQYEEVSPPQPILWGEKRESRATRLCLLVCDWHCRRDILTTLMIFPYVMLMTGKAVILFSDHLATPRVQGGRQIAEQTNVAMPMYHGLTGYSAVDTTAQEPAHCGAQACLYNFSTSAKLPEVGAEGPVLSLAALQRRFLQQQYPPGDQA